jgi:hypothetical protein
MKLTAIFVKGEELGRFIAELVRHREIKTFPFK